MGDLLVTIHLGDGRELELPFAQAVAIGRCLQKFEHPVWHKNECGCCISVHDRDDHTRGYVIGRDGGTDYIEHGTH